MQRAKLRDVERREKEKKKEREREREMQPDDIEFP